MTPQYFFVTWLMCLEMYTYQIFSDFDVRIISLIWKLLFLIIIGVRIIRVFVVLQELRYSCNVWHLRAVNCGISIFANRSLWEPRMRARCILGGFVFHAFQQNHVSSLPNLNYCETTRIVVIYEKSKHCENTYKYLSINTFCSIKLDNIQYICASQMHGHAQMNTW